MGRLTPPLKLALTALALTGALSACDTVEQFIGAGDQVLTVSPKNGAAYAGRCVPRGAEPVEISGKQTRTWTFEDGVACRIVQQGEGSLTVEITGPDGTTTATTSRAGEVAAVSRG